MESPAKAILTLLDASAPAAVAARHGVAASGSIRPTTRQAAPSADAAPSARRHRPHVPIPDPAPDRNTIGQPLLRRTAHIQSHTKYVAAVASAPGRHQRNQFGSETGSRWSSGLLFKR